MAPKKNQLFQILVPMVDKVDFASIESAITESDFNSAVTKKWYGVNHGVSDLYTSGTISKAGRLARSGVFQLTLKTTENNYDRMQIRVTHPSCAEQIVEWENEAYDNSDLYSALSDLASDLRSVAIVGQSFLSDILSRVVVVASMASDAASAALQVNSRVLVAQSFLSDIRSQVSDLQSDFQSRVPKLVATNSQLSDAHSDLRSAIANITVALTPSDISDIASAVAAAVTTITASDISDIASRVDTVLASRLSDILSAAQQTNSRALVGQSYLSDIRSQLTAGVPLDASTLSDLRSAITAGAGAGGPELSLADIVSAIRADLSSDLSDILSAAQQGNSRVLVGQSYLSDIRSQLSDLQSDFQSRVPKRVATDSQLSAMTSDVLSAIAAGGAGVTVSDISDIASRVETVLASRLSDILSAAQQTNSRALVGQSYLSDIRSHLTAGVPLDASTMSDIRSAIGNISVTLTTSDISDIASAVAGAVTTITASDISDIASRVETVLASRLSDILSAAQQTNSRTLVGQSYLSDIRSHLSDFQSDFQSRVPKLVATNSQVAAGVPLDASTLSDLRSAITAGGGGGGGVTTSDISDIASRVETVLASRLSDILSAAQQTNSRALVAQSNLSDVYSRLLTLPDASDVASAVWSEPGTEPVAVPAHTATRGAKVDWMLALTRNKIRQTGTAQHLRNLADTDTIASAAVADSGGSFVREGWS